MNPDKARDFVLVHGAFHGAWCWHRVSEPLRKAGHRVFTPTLTGLGERSHLATKSVGLRTHITDIEQVLEFEELSDVVLVGHSYASYVVSGVADGYRERIGRLVYVDSFLPKSGTSFYSNIPQTVIDQIAGSLVDGYLVPAFAPEFFGVLPSNSPDWSWVKRHLTPQPVATFSETLLIKQSLNDISTHYIRCTGASPLDDDTVSRDIMGLPGWNYHRLATGHDAMITMPGDLAALLLKIAG